MAGRMKVREAGSKLLIKQYYERNCDHDKVTFTHSNVCVINTTYDFSF